MFHQDLKARTLDFLTACEKSPFTYALTPQAETTPYARCFAVFLMHLLQALPADRASLAALIERDVREARDALSKNESRTKPYRQLLTFSLSALAALGMLRKETLADLVEEQLPQDVAAELAELGCLRGVGGSGNQAMFLGIFLIHARDILHLPVQGQIDAWVDLHLAHMDRFGFWGGDKGMTHLHFQNGYHQYEILAYLDIPNPRLTAAQSAVLALPDSDGHFAPYHGGGGCYDYDAVAILTENPKAISPETAAALRRLSATLLAEECAGGGFAENHFIRPRSVGNLARHLRRVMEAGANGALLTERMRYALTLQRPVHDRIATHWSRYSRGWGEADLWDTWFRLLALARIDLALGNAEPNDYGFIDYPGIGFWGHS